MLMLPLENHSLLNENSIQNLQRQINSTISCNTVTIQNTEITGLVDPTAMLKPNIFQAMQVMFLKSNLKTSSQNLSLKPQLELLTENMLKELPHLATIAFWQLTLENSGLKISVDLKTLENAQHKKEI